MKLVIALVLLFVVTLAHKNHHKQAQWSYDQGVLILHNGNFDQAIQSFHTLLVDFYAPWCPHCQKLAPEFALAANQLNNQGVVLAKVDCTRDVHLADRFHINGYPTLKIFTQNIEYPYHGRRSHNEIVSYMLTHIQAINVAQNNFLHRKLERIEIQKSKFDQKQEVEVQKEVANNKQKQD